MERKEFDQPMRKCQQYLGQFLDVLDVKKPVANVALNTSLFLGHEKETQHSLSLALEASNKENDFLKKKFKKNIYPLRPVYTGDFLLRYLLRFQARFLKIIG